MILLMEGVQFIRSVWFHAVSKMPTCSERISIRAVDLPSYSGTDCRLITYLLFLYICDKIGAGCLK